ncbi:MAG: helix-turn-helix domain-containing protein [Archangium sp.]
MGQKVTEVLRGDWGEVKILINRYGPRSEPTVSPVPENTVSICLEGRADIVRHSPDGETKFELTEGDIYQQESMTPLDGFGWEGESTTMHIILSPGLFDRAQRAVFGDDANSRRFVCPAPFRDDVILSIAQAFRDEAEKADAGSNMMARALAEVLALRVLRFHVARGATIPVSATRLDEGGMRKLRAYALENLSGDLSLEKLAAVVELGVPHFSSLFRRAFGLTPHDWVMQLRLDRASELLRERSHSLAQVAELAGFADQSHLTRRFKQRFGLSPRRWQIKAA